MESKLEGTWSILRLPNAMRDFSCKCVFILAYLCSSCICSWMINILLQWIFLVFACTSITVVLNGEQNCSQGHFWLIVMNEWNCVIWLPEVLFPIITFYYIVCKANFSTLSVIVATVCVCITWREITKLWQNAS